VETIALVGPSGTGKSHRALVVAHEYDADAIIDDGLLIIDSKIAAGLSAKKEPSKIKAVKRAIFMDEEHAAAVRKAIAERQPKRILILGTSLNMVSRIVETLSLPALSKVLRIEDIASKREMEVARESRIKEGKHIIPVPTIELKPHFSGYSIDSLIIFFRKQAKQRRLEKSIIRPAFSYYGKLLISDEAIAAIVRQEALADPFITRTGQITIKNSSTQDRDKGIFISIDVTIKYGSTLPIVLASAQKRIKATVEYMTGMTVNQVNIEAKRLSFD